MLIIKRGKDLQLCSNIDNKEQKRFAIFNRWYQYSKYKTVIKKIDNIIKIEEENDNTTIFTSFMYHKDNPNSYKIIYVSQRQSKFQ